ncbi:MAG: AraC family transcriptional regulator [Verrucomicrobia bacterium]|nr:MAG: AraC family transcriptional regulator [Verrucomicrobiota bacterium]
MERRILRELVAKHAVRDGVTETPIAGLRLFRVSSAVERLPTVYPPSLCCLVQGEKRVYLDGELHAYDADHYLCVTMPLPVEAEIPAASPEEPILGFLLDLDTRTMTETLVAYEAAARSDTEDGAAQGASARGMAVAEVDARFVAAAARLLELLDDPVALAVLGEGRLREALFALIEGGAGMLVRRSFAGVRGVMRAVAHLREHLHEPISVDELARAAGMSRAVFHRRFKAVTGAAPLQFIKAMRLHRAAIAIIGGRTVGEAAEAVGYTSVSQFSREFRRQFGQSPRGWARSMTPVAMAGAASVI